MRIMNLTHEPENEIFEQFRHVDTSVKRATDEFRDSADRQAQCRREFVQVMKNQLNIMIELRENQERNRKFVKNALKDSNATYIGFRTKEIPKVSKLFHLHHLIKWTHPHVFIVLIQLRKAYEQKCVELETAQRMSLQESQQPPPASLSVPPPLVQQHSSSSLASGPPPGPQLLLQQPYRYPMDGSMEDPPSSQRRSEDTDESSLSSIDANSPQPQKRMAGLMAKMAHMGTQLANAAAAASAPDVSKQNVKNAKTKKDIVDTGTTKWVSEQGLVKESRVKCLVLRISYCRICRCRVSRRNSLSGAFEKKADRRNLFVFEGNAGIPHTRTRDIGH